jgi:hypothetical protein
MAIRLAFAVNVMVDPDILIIDEALAVGDIFFQQKCFRFLREKFKDRTRILVSHDMNALNTVVDRVLVLNRGALLFDGPVRDGIALYVKLMQADAFGTVETPAAPETEVATRAAEEGVDPLSAEKDVVDDEVPAEEGSLPFRTVDDEMLSGRGEARFLRAALVRVDSRDPVISAEPGDALEIIADFRTKRDAMSLLFGYMLHDKRGKEICGDTTLPVTGNEPIALGEAGVYRYHLRFTWPKLRPDDYTITIGIGEGSLGHDHVVQGWANHIFLVKAMSTEAEIHGVFANPIDTFTINPRGHG